MEIGTKVYVKHKGCKCRGEIVSREFPYYIVQLYGSGLELSFTQMKLRWNNGRSNTATETSIIFFLI